MVLQMAVLVIHKYSHQIKTKKKCALKQTAAEYFEFTMFKYFKIRVFLASSGSPEVCTGLLEFSVTLY